MPIILPPGLLPVPVLFEPEEVLSGSRSTEYVFDLMDHTEQLIGSLTNVSGGSIEWTSGTAIKAGGSITVTDLGQQIDWLNVRIRPRCLVSSVGTEEPIETGLGVYLAAAPVEDWDETGRVWSVELLDKLSLLDGDIVTDLNGDPVTYVAPVGANVIQIVVDLIEGIGETAPAIVPDTKVLANSMTWDVGTSILQIINDLLEAAGYASLWTDGWGQFRAEPYVSPANRTPVYEALNPFSKGDGSLMGPKWRNDKDIYGIPNRYVAISQGSGDEESLVAVATNEDPSSPFSYQARGRWVTRVVTGVEATSQEDLEARALMGLSQASSVTAGISLEHVFLPDLLINRTVKFTNPDAGLDLLCYVTKTSVEFDPTALCKTEIREAVV
jgi:hypothetical protein